MSARKPKIGLAMAPEGSPAPVAGTGDPVVRFEIHHYGCLNHLGEATQPMPPVAHDPERLIALYRAMFLTRRFDTKAIALQRTGQLGTYASSLGQEAIGVAIGSAMRPEDVLVPAYREYGAQFLRGVSMTDILLYWGGDERGMNYRAAREDFPVCIPVASQSAHAAGIACAFKQRRQPRVAVCVLGDGGTSKGDFYEAINLAGTWQLPVLFVVNNNQWAISVSREKQSAAATLAQKAIAGGFRGEQVDGNDVIALYDRVSHALEAIRNGNGPVLIEALTYRMSDHTTADDASRYRPDEEVAAQQTYDPLQRLRKYLLHAGYWSAEQDSRLNDECTAEVEAAVKAYLETPAQPPESMFDYLYAELPNALAEQREQVCGRNTDD